MILLPALAWAGCRSRGYDLLRPHSFMHSAGQAARPRNPTQKLTRPSDRMSLVLAYSFLFSCDKHIITLLPSAPDTNNLWRGKLYCNHHGYSMPGKSGAPGRSPGVKEQIKSPDIIIQPFRAGSERSGNQPRLGPESHERCSGGRI